MSDQDQANRDFARARQLIGQGRAELNQALEILRGLLPEIHNTRGRGTINNHIWECERALGRQARYYSQSGQDAWLDAKVFKGKRGGTFVEIGGHDGVTGSNCLYFETMRGWSGLLVEPSPALHEQAAQTRRCPCLQLAVSATNGTAAFLDVRAGLTQMGGLVDSYDPETRATVEADPRHQGTVIEVETQPLARILGDRGMREIDYISLDVEGGEQKILETFPFADFPVTAWTVENNSGATGIQEIMQANGYRRVEALGVDDVYLSAAFDPESR